MSKDGQQRKGNISSKVQNAKTINDYYINDYWSLSVKSFNKHAKWYVKGIIMIVRPKICPGNRPNTERGVSKADLDESWGKIFLQASRSFLYSSGTSETTRNHKKTTFYFLYKFKKSLFWDLDIGFQTFGPGPREEILRRIRICCPKYLFLSSNTETLGKTKTVKIQIIYKKSIYSLFGGYIVPI